MCFFCYRSVPSSTTSDDEASTSEPHDVAPLNYIKRKIRQIPLYVLDSRRERRAPALCFRCGKKLSYTMEELPFMPYPMTNSGSCSEPENTPDPAESQAELDLDIALTEWYRAFLAGEEGLDLNAAAETVMAERRTQRQGLNEPDVFSRPWWETLRDDQHGMRRLARHGREACLDSAEAPALTWEMLLDADSDYSDDDFQPNLSDEETRPILPHNDHTDGGGPATLLAYVTQPSSTEPAWATNVRISALDGSRTYRLPDGDSWRLDFVAPGSQWTICADIQNALIGMAAIHLLFMLPYNAKIRLHS